VVTSPGAGTPNRLLYVEAPTTTTPLAVTNPGTQTSTSGKAVSLTLKATDGSPPYTWSATGLPAGLTINTSTGVVSGTPTTAATTNVTVTAKDAAGLTASTSFSWTVTTAPAACTSSGQKLANPGFDSGPVNWTGTPGAINVRVGATRSGLWNAVLGGRGTAGTSTVSQTVAIPAGCSTYTLSFWLRVDSAETSTAQNDRLTVTAGSSTLATYSNLDKSAGYVQKSVSVADQAGKTVPVTFTATENASPATSFAIDDTALTVG
jgi:hypothetical protein